MADENPSALSHVSIGTNDLRKAVAFYDAVLPSLGIRMVHSVDGEASAYGKQFPEFWVHAPHDGKPATVGNGFHVAFMASGKAAVDAFHAAALAAGAQDDGPPGPRAEYGTPYYGCFVRDLEGNKIEATYWDMALMDVADG